MKCLICRDEHEIVLFNGDNSAPKYTMTPCPECSMSDEARAEFDVKSRIIYWDHGQEKWVEEAEWIELGEPWVAA